MLRTSYDYDCLSDLVNLCDHECNPIYVAGVGVCLSLIPISLLSPTELFVIHIIAQRGMLNSIKGKVMNTVRKLFHPIKNKQLRKEK